MPEHPFYAPTKGWTEAIHLRAGDKLFNHNGELMVIEQVQHEILEAPVVVYNFEVADYHTYFVGTNGVLVHNSCSQTLPRDGTKVDSTKALDMADSYLGKGYTEMSPGRFVSADGLRQVRRGNSDILGLHGNGPHINYECLQPNPYRPGKFNIIGNSHIYIFD